MLLTLLFHFLQLYTVFSGPKTLVKNLAKNLVKNLDKDLAKNLAKNLVKNRAKNLVPKIKKYFGKVNFRSTC